MEFSNIRFINAQLCILILSLISGIGAELLSTDPCDIDLRERKVEYLDQSMDYRASNCQRLSEDIGIAWSIEGNTIKFEVHALAEGWVAIGINNGPSMLRADIALGWVNSKGLGFLVDGKNNDLVKEVPKKDPIQDVTLLKYKEKDGYTSFLFSRPLISEDKENDIDIQGRVWIVWAFSTDDPDDEDWEDLAYHVASGATSIRFLNDKEESEKDVKEEL